VKPQGRTKTEKRIAGLALKGITEAAGENPVQKT